MNRRDLLRATARAAAAAVLLPRAASAQLVWQRVGAHPPSRVQSSLVVALADTILPRTDTPSASDVNVEGFVDVIVTEYYTEPERRAFLDGLEAIDALAAQLAGAPFASLTPAQRLPVMDALEQPVDRAAPSARSYARLKALVVHGYFTSERVQREVLELQIIPGRFDGAAPLRVRARGEGSTLHGSAER